jgi:hypothetical protein
MVHNAIGDTYDEVHEPLAPRLEVGRLHDMSVGQQLHMIGDVVLDISEHGHSCESV